MSGYDLNDAEPNTFECIPDGTQVPVIFKLIVGEASDNLHPTKDGRARMVKLEAVVTDGPYAKRRVFLNLLLDSSDKMDEGHKKAIEISKSTLRAIVEAAKGFSPTDETPAAVAARHLKSVNDLDQLECTIVVGIEIGTGSYPDKNVVKRVVPVGGKSKPPPGEGAAAAASRPRTGSGGAAAKPAAKSSWA
jgi:hypothetical protein